MKKLLFLPILLLIITFSACSVKEARDVECVNDSLITIKEPAFYVSADIPQGTFLTASCKDGCCALFSHEDYEVMQEIFYADSLDEALVYLTGQTREELNLLSVSSFPKEEYRFAWTAAGENGTLACSGMLFADGDCYYSLCIFCKAEMEKEHREDFSAIFAGTELMPV